MKLQLIDEWKHTYLYWSQRMQAICIAISSWYVVDPNSMLWVWNSLPHDVRMLLPPTLSKTVGVIIMAAAGIGLVARGVKQPKAEAKIAAKQEAKSGSV